jgi:O-antigen/teichoic acid export membrane protein
MIRETFRYMFLRGSINVASLLSLIMVARLMGPEESGKAILVVSLVAGLSALVGFGNDAALARFVIKAGRQLSRYLYHRALLFLATGLFLNSALLLGARSLMLLPSEVDKVCFLALGLISCYGITSTNVFLLRGAGKLNLTSLLEGANEVGSRVIGMLAVLLVDPSYVLYLKIQFLIAFLVVIASTWSAYRTVAEMGPDAERDVLTDCPPPGYRMFASMSWANSLVSLVYNNVNVWMLRYLCSPREVGLFSVANRIPATVVTVVLAPLNVPLLYHLSLAEERGDEHWRGLAQAVGLLSVVIGCFSLTVAAVSRWAVPLLFGSAFAGAIPACMIAAHVPFLMAYQGLINPLLASRNRLHFLNLMTLLHIAFNALLNWRLIPTLSVSGASLALAGGHVVVALVVGVYLRDVVRGLLKVVVGLYSVYLPCALLIGGAEWAFHSWVLNIALVPLFPVCALLTRVVDRSLVRAVTKRAWDHLREISTT